MRRTIARLRDAGAGLPGGGLGVCALDTELLGHWWYEGIEWLSAVVQECSRQGLELVRLDDALARLEPAPASEWRGAESEGESGDGSRRGRFGEERQTTSWGAHGDLSTWSGPAVAEVAFALRRAELEVIAAGALADPTAVRELLALQSSDWAFMVARGIAAPYARQRFGAHAERLRSALSQPGDGDAQALRNLAAYAITPDRRAPAARAGATQPQRIVVGASRMRITRAGTPPTTALSGTSLVSTALVPTMLLSPTVTPRRTQAP